MGSESTKVFVLLSVFLMACGGGSNKSSAGAPASSGYPMSMVLNSTEDLPQCLPQNKNQLIYIQNETKFIVCDGVAWSTIEIKGDAGAQGEKGEKGDQGNTGGLKFVFDSAGRSLGWLVSTSVQEGSDGANSYLNVLLLNGHVMAVNFSNGHFAKNNLSVTGCYYSSTDCSGTCVAALPDTNTSFIKGYNSKNFPTYFLPGASDLGSFTFNSVVLGNNTSFSCTVTSGTLSSSFSTTSFTLSSGATYPYSAPLRIDGGS